MILFAVPIYTQIDFFRVKPIHITTSLSGMVIRNPFIWVSISTYVNNGIIKVPISAEIGVRIQQSTSKIWNYLEVGNASLCPPIWILHFTLTMECPRLKFKNYFTLKSVKLEVQDEAHSSKWPHMIYHFICFTLLFLFRMAWKSQSLTK